MRETKWEYKTERLVGLEQMSKIMLENSLNIAAIADWELVCVAERVAFYRRERKPNGNNESPKERQ